MMRGEREIVLTTPVSLTAFQPSLWNGSSLLRFQAFHAWLRSQVPTGQNPTGSQGFTFRTPRAPSPVSHNATQDSAAPFSTNYGSVSFGTPVLIEGGGVRPHCVFGADLRLTLSEPPPVIWFAVIHGLVWVMPFSLTESM
jgi:hypothetical protein